MASVAALARYFEKTAAVGPAPAAAPLPASTSGSGSRIARVPQHKLAAFTVSAAPTGKPSTTTPRTLGPLHAKWQAAIENNSSVVTLVSPTFTLAAAAAADHGHAEEAVDDDSTGNEEMVVSAADTDDEDEITEETADSLAPASTYSSSNPPSVILQAEEATVTETVDDEERSIASVQSVILAPFAMLVQKCPEAAAPPVHCGVKPVAPLIRADSRQPAADDSDLKMPHHAMPATATSKAVANPYHGPHWLSFPPAGIAVAITTVSAQAYARTVRDPVVWEETEGTDGDNSSSGLRVKAERDLKRWHALGAEAQLVCKFFFNYTSSTNG
ncbi:hypothetical protein BC828DRAFT_154878 [Blastocladiella britannica]|nr:hypothetical protein BC828DRAFT_154878 [Blastocladiella britannica]